MAGFGKEPSYRRFLGPVPQLLPSAGSECGGCLGFFCPLWGFLCLVCLFLHDSAIKNTTGMFIQCSLCKPTVLSLSSTNS